MKAFQNKKQIDSKAAIIRATLDLAIESGWKDVSIRKIADSLNCSTIVVYDKFGNKNELLLAILQYGYDELRALYETRLQPECTAREAVLVLSNCTWEFAENHAELYKLMFGLSGVLEFGDTHYISGTIAQFVQRQMTPLFKDDVKSGFTNWWALVHGFITIKFMGDAYPNMLKIYFDDAIRRFIDSVGYDSINNRTES